MNGLLIRNGVIVTLEVPNRILTGHALLIEDGIIRAIRPQEEPKAAGVKSIDARGKVVMPGFINAHTHFYSGFARGLTGVKPSANFSEILRNLWWRLDRSLTLEDCHYSALAAGIEAIRHGTTTIIDHHSSPSAVRGSLHRIAAAVRKLGLRACLCYEVSDRNGRKAAQEGIDENLRFIEECSRGSDDRLKALFGLHASFTLGDRTLKRCADAARKLGTGFHIHCAEDASDQALTRKRYGKSVVRRLLDHGILGPQTLCAHAVHIGDSEWDLLAKSGSAVIHNPQSNMNNGVGVMDLLKAVRKKVLVGLGTDAMTNDMREELRSAIWVQRLRHKNPGVGFGETVGLLVKDNREIAGRYFANVGQLKEGWKADVILVDYRPPTPMTAGNFFGHLVFGLSQAEVDTTIVGGRILMADRVLTGQDEGRILRRTQQLSRALWKRF